uniref:Amino acid transporter transmembrane domain-containing protein n=1 Tax=Phaeomonas parva TaxID=124430 RepID=A0A7S1XS86_9STRA
MLLLLLLLLGAVAGRDLPGAAQRLAPRANPKAAAAAPAVAQRGGGGAVAVSDGKSSVPVATFNLMNNVAGAGLLTLSAAMAMGVGTYPALILCVGLGIVAGHTFSLCNRACAATGETSFMGLCTRLLGPFAALTSTVALAALCFAVCIVYAGFIGDVATSLLAEPIGLSPALNSRASNILVTTGGVLLPLCLLRSLDQLGFTSLLGLVSVVYSVAFIILRSLDGTYAPGGEFFEDLVKLGDGAAPAFDDVGPWAFDSRALVLISNLGVSFMAHYNAPKYYDELRDNTVERCNMVSWPSYIGLSVLYAATMIAGYRTFGTSCKSMLLTNYSSKDRLGCIAQFATGFSILFGYPLAFCGFRQGVVETADAILGFRDGAGGALDGALKALRDAPSTEGGWRALTVALLALSTALAVAVEDMGIVVGIAGAVVGSYFIYMLPALLYTTVEERAGRLTPAKKANLALVPMGVAMAAMGTFMSVKSRS